MASSQMTRHSQFVRLNARDARMDASRPVMNKLRRPGFSNRRQTRRENNITNHEILDRLGIHPFMEGVLCNKRLDT